ncbi:DJ-1/PfpI family protein [Kibdelosporangium philippinense]|uniref:DJ-1/PfpI family protein n=1 Tax=Kibdelosporangium philippinense TaxID=211113 RepID=A0ABS8ZRQ2_9PSEU|nr:DJ-1/PfpI family protein [Kibdelosporangium philippinense]MCE7010401.1 DJ-1/PfpI family protein [Kibdelosporangium philippinense]
MQRRTFLRASALSAGVMPMGAPIAEAEQSTLRVQVLAYEGAEELDFVAPFDVLAMAGHMSNNRIRTTLVSTNKPTTITASKGMRIEVPRGWSPQDADILVVPGGGFANRPGSGLAKLLADKVFMRRLAAVEAVTVGVCTGVMALSAAGFTKGRSATTHAGAKADLAAQGATVINARVVDDGDLVTCGGITSGLDAAIWLVERFLGPQLATQVETVMEYERRGTVWRS